MVYNCVICGKESIPYNKRSKCCSKECSKENNRLHNKERTATQAYKDKHKITLRNKRIVICRLCGKRIYRTVDINERASTSMYHDECVVNDCIDTIKQGKTLSRAQYSRLYSRGYSLDDLKG